MATSRDDCRRDHVILKSPGQGPLWTKLERVMGRVMRGADWQPLRFDQLVRSRNGALEHRLKIRCGTKVAKVDLTEAEVLEFHEVMALAAADPGGLASA